MQKNEMNLIDGFKAAFTFLSSVIFVISVCFLGRWRSKAQIYFACLKIFVFVSSTFRLVLGVQVVLIALQGCERAAGTFKRAHWSRKRNEAEIKENSSRLTNISPSHHLSNQSSWMSAAQNPRTSWTCSIATCCVCLRIIKWNITFITD